MTVAENIYQRSLKLPKQAAQEALDFVEFLESRYAKQELVSWRTTVGRFAGVLGQDFPEDISDSDLGQDSSRDRLQ